jgi:hypothetical protein
VSKPQTTMFDGRIRIWAGHGGAEGSWAVCSDEECLGRRYARSDLLPTLEAAQTWASEHARQHHYHWGRVTDDIHWTRKKVWP